MSISSRIESTIESWRAKWGQALKDFLAQFLGFGIELFFDVLGKAASPKLEPLITRLEATGKVPPELQPLLDEIKNPKGEVGAMFAQSASSALVGGAIGKILDALLLPAAFAVNSVTRNVELSADQMIKLWLRGIWNNADLDKKLSWLGLPTDNVSNLKELSQVRLDASTVMNAWRRDAAQYEPLIKDLRDQGLSDDRIAAIKLITEARLDPRSVITAWRRDPAKYESLFKDLKDQGWTDDRIEALKFTTLYYPSAQDLITWVAREVFEPDSIQKYGLEEEFGLVNLDMFAGAGVSEEQAKNYWIAHWQHASFSQMQELLHRGLLTGSRNVPSEPGSADEWAARDAQGEQEMYSWYRLVEVAPIWRDLLTAQLWNVPTRVDVRRFWDMRTIDENRLRSIYHAQGYHGQDLEDYILWTKVYVAFPDLLARFQKGWITEDDVRSTLISLGMPEDRVTEMIQTKVAPEKPAQVEAERQATATEIMKGVKQGVIDRATGVGMLGDLGYSEDTANFKLNVYLQVSSGSPDNYVEFKEMTQLYRKAVGQQANVPSAELIEAGKAMKQAQNALRDAEGQNKTGAELAEYQKSLSDTQYRYRQLLIAWEGSQKKMS